MTKNILDSEDSDINNKEKVKSINKTDLSLQNNYNRNIFNLKLPKLCLHQKNKSHFDIMENLTRDLKLIKASNVNSSNDPSYLNLNRQSFMLHKGNQQENLNLNNYSSYINTNNLNEGGDEILDTEEKKLRVLNLKRIKPKKLPLELEKPKHNNTRQGPQSLVFLKNFINKCKSEQKNVNSVISDISSNIVNTNEYYKNDTINIVRRLIEDEMNQGIDKEIYLMDNPNGKREKTIILKGPPIKGEHKYLFENKNSPLLVGDIISKIDGNFAFKCKDVVESRFVILNIEQKRRKKFAEEAKIERIKAVKKAELHKQIDQACEKIHKTKINALKVKNYDEI